MPRMPSRPGDQCTHARCVLPQIRATAKYAGLTLSCAEVRLDEWAQLKSDAPMATNLILCYGDNGSEFHLTSSLTMMSFVASLVPASELLGQNQLERAQIDGWADFIWHSIDLPLHALRSMDPPEADLTKEIHCQLGNALLRVQNHLQNNPYLVGTKFSLADLSLAISLSETPQSAHPSEGSVLADWSKRTKEALKT